MLTCRSHGPRVSCLRVASPVALTLPPAASNLKGPLFPVKLPNTSATGPRLRSIPNTSPLLKVKAMLARSTAVAFRRVLLSSPPQPKIANDPAHTTKASRDHNVCPYVRQCHAQRLPVRLDTLWSDIISPPCNPTATFVFDIRAATQYAPPA